MEQTNLWRFFGENWKGYEEKLKKNWEETVMEEDTVIIPGDFSWAMYLQEAYKDFEYLNNLPRQKDFNKRQPWLLVGNSNKNAEVLARK